LRGRGGRGEGRARRTAGRGGARRPLGQLLDLLVLPLLAAERADLRKGNARRSAPAARPPRPRDARTLLVFSQREMHSRWKQWLHAPQAMLMSCRLAAWFSIDGS
jgi:hypothetical protein